MAQEDNKCKKSQRLNSYSNKARRVFYDNADIGKCQIADWNWPELYFTSRVLKLD